MKKVVFCMILSILLLIPLAGYSDTFPDNDTDGYWGGAITLNGNPYSGNYKDVIGSHFDVAQMEVIQNGNNWTVILSGGDYFTYRLLSAGSNNLTPNYGPGDLYLSIGEYSVTQSSDSDVHFVNDVFSVDEGWNYVVPLKGNDSGSGDTGLYKLDLDSANYEWTDAPANHIYRANQAWQGGYSENGASIGGAGYAFGTNSLTFTFNTSELTIPFDEIGFHWTMMCGNDILENRVPAKTPPTEAPEPGTLLLLGLGLSGIAVYKKYRK